MNRLKIPALSASVALAAVAALALAIGLMGQGTAQADERVPTGAKVGGTGSAPVVQCKWELPDMDRNSANGVQYVTGTHIHDDDPSVPGQPCDSYWHTTGPMMHVSPNLENQPTTRAIEYFASVSDPNGIADVQDVFTKVWEPPLEETGQCLTQQPDGTFNPQPGRDHPTKGNHAAEGELMCFKYQLHLNPLVCPQPGDDLIPGHWLHAAVHSGQMSQAEADLIIQTCPKNEKAVWSAVGDLDKHQACGHYHVETTAVDTAGNTDTMYNDFEVQCVVGLALDFTQIDWEEIVPGIPKYKSGNMTFDPSEDPSKPTVKNLGNTRMYMSIHFDPLIGVTLGKEITQFDAKFQPEDEAMQTIDPIFASEWHTFCPGLDSNEVGQLDVSIHAPLGTPNDTYSGNVDLVGGTDACE